MRVSTVSTVTKRVIVTGFVCPMRCTRFIACSYCAGFHVGYIKKQWFAAVSVIPTPQVLIVASNTRGLSRFVERLHGFSLHAWLSSSSLLAFFIIIFWLWSSSSSFTNYALLSSFFCYYWSATVLKRCKTLSFSLKLNWPVNMMHEMPRYYKQYCK